MKSYKQDIKNSKCLQLFFFNAELVFCRGTKMVALIF